MFDEIAHVGVAVKSLDEAVRFYTEKLGMRAKGEWNNERDKVRIALLDIGNADLELLAPSSPDSLLVKFLERRGEGIHHICVKVSDIEEALRRMRSEGIQLVDETPRVSPFGGKIAFVHPKSTHGVLIELYQD